jgi:hypothetical protein
MSITKLACLIGLFVGACVAETPEPEFDERKPPPSGGTGSISGTVFDQAGVPVPSATIWFWVWTGPNSGSSKGSTVTNGAGQYTKTGLPSSGTVMLQINRNGFWQPCVTQKPYTSGAVVNGLVHSDAYIRGGGAPPADASPLIVGRVTDAATDAPIAGATVWIDMLYGLGLVAGITTTDANGNYFACRIPNPGATLQYTAPGYAYAETWVDPVDAIVDMPMTGE